MAIVAGLFGRLLGWRKGAVAAVIAIALYTVLVWAVLAAGFLLFFILRALAGRILPAVPPLSFYAPSPEGFPRAVIPIPLLLLVFACGGLRYQLAQPRIDTSHVAWYRDRGEAVVVEEVLVEHTPGNRFMAAIYALKGRALQTIYRHFPDPEASLMAGILLGVEAGIPADVRQAFQDTGTAHIIAISGQNAIVFIRVLPRSLTFEPL